MGPRPFLSIAGQGGLFDDLISHRLNRQTSPPGSQPELACNISRGSHPLPRGTLAPRGVSAPPAHAPKKPSRALPNPGPPPSPVSIPCGSAGHLCNSHYRLRRAPYAFFDISSCHVPGRPPFKSRTTGPWTRHSGCRTSLCRSTVSSPRIAPPRDPRSRHLGSCKMPQNTALD